MKTRFLPRPSQREGRRPFEVFLGTEGAQKHLKSGLPRPWGRGPGVGMNSSTLCYPGRAFCLIDLYRIREMFFGAPQVPRSPYSFLIRFPMKRILQTRKQIGSSFVNNL
jgi:hypothetical protein